MPYLAANIAEFWRRWHISLSTWLRDYVYIPLGGSRGGQWLTARNLVITMTLGGLWHGASWNFVIWGLWHGTFLVIERIASNRGDRGTPIRSHLYTMLVVMIGWVFFRAETLPDAVAFLKAMAGLTVPAYAIDDETAIKVVGRTVEVVSEGKWQLFNARANAREVS